MRHLAELKQSLETCLKGTKKTLASTTKNWTAWSYWASVQYSRCASLSIFLRKITKTLVSQQSFNRQDQNKRLSISDQIGHCRELIRANCLGRALRRLEPVQSLDGLRVRSEFKTFSGYFNVYIWFYSDSGRISTASKVLCKTEPQSWENGRHKRPGNLINWSRGCFAFRFSFVWDNLTLWSWILKLVPKYNFQIVQDFC